ncbi:MAG: glycosyltransferase, partial [Promethearchaeota archaeon]
SGPSVDKCSKCMKYYFPDKREARKQVKAWMKHMKKINDMVDLFIAPSRFLRDIYIKYGIPENRIIYQDYGFKKSLMDGVTHERNSKIKFGFTGRLIPVKGISLLIDAFKKLDPEKAELLMYGNNGHDTYLKDLLERMDSVSYKGSYNNEFIASIFSGIDVLVVPSIWYENSPLVIHEAFLAKVPVITTDLGGMSELVKDGENGLLFKRNDPDDLANKMQMFVENPELLDRLIKPVTPVRDIKEDAADILKIYRKIISKTIKKK